MCTYILLSFLCTLSPCSPVSVVQFMGPFLQPSHSPTATPCRQIDRFRFANERKCSICVFLPHYCLSLLFLPLRQFLPPSPCFFSFTLLWGKDRCLVVFGLFHVAQWSLDPFIFLEMIKSHSSLWLNKSPLWSYTTLAWESEEIVRTLFSTPH